MSLSQALNQFAQNLGRYQLSSQQKKLLNDYRLIQYDMTAGKNYLSSTKFFDVK